LKRFLTTWSRYPLIESEVEEPSSLVEAREYCQRKSHFIAYGCGRSYGDAPLGNFVLKTRRFRFFHHFDPQTGELTAEAGVTLEEIIKHFLPRGWFLPVTPGTKFVSLGGAVAADVHGKNHHVDGSFCNWITGIWLLLPDGKEIFCSPEENTDWFRMTCGGMGLTGLITKVRLRLRPVQSSFIEETIIKCPNLEESLSIFEEYSSSPYSVAWLDCTARGKSFGRSLLMLGLHAAEGELFVSDKKTLSFPVDAPSFLLNPYTIKLFNDIYYSRIKREIVQQRVTYEDFFYPLDKINHWNRLYGKNGFLQYQFLIPKTEAQKAIREILFTIKEYDEAPFLAVLKLLGKGNDFPLSFPREGYTLALDFKLTPRVFSLFRILDEIVHYYGGRIYLAKDARLSRKYLESGYQNLEQFIRFRKEKDLFSRVRSQLSDRLSL